MISYLSTYYPLYIGKINTYKKIFICRNPYSRIVSCYIDKYIGERFTKYMNYNIIINKIINKFGIQKNTKFTFENFIDIFYEIHKNKWTIFLLEKDHLLQQFNNNIMINNIYQLENFDEKNFLLNELNIDIDKKINNDFGHTSNCSSSKYKIDKAYKINYDEMLFLKTNNKIPNYTCFYNNSIKNKIDEIYKNDFLYLKKFNIYYDLKI